MKHIMFLFLTIAYSMGMPTLAVLAFLVMKYKERILLYMIPFHLVGTAQLIFLTYLEYRYANIPFWFFNIYDVINYFLQSLSIFATPLLINELFKVPFRQKLNCLFGGFVIVALFLIGTPYFSGALREGEQIESLLSFKIYLLILTATNLYALIVFILRFKLVRESLERHFYISSAVICTVMVSQSIVPIFNSFPEDLIIFGVAYLIWNLLFLRYLAIRFIGQSTAPQSVPHPEIMNSTKLTNREKEILQLLLEGCPNREIGTKLYITDATVKTHIQNIYKKFGVRNRVQLFNMLKEEAAPHSATISQM